MDKYRREKYFVLNKESDYRRGYYKNLICDCSGIYVDDREAGSGIFFSRVFDSQETGNIWHRITLSVTHMESSAFKISFYAADDLNLRMDGKSTKIGNVPEASWETADAEEKKRICAEYQKKEVLNSDDILLHDVSGRYLWFVIEIYQQTQQKVAVSNIILYFPKQTLIKFLPEIYDRSGSQDSFLERYLAVFQSLYEDVNRKIEQIPGYLEPAAADRENLEWIAEWIGVRNIGLWSLEQLRYLTAHAAGLYRKRGTRSAIAGFVKLYTRELPFIAEQHQIMRFRNQEKLFQLYLSLYGNDPYVFTILIRQQCLPTGKEYSDLKKILEDVKPAWMEVRIITLRPYLLLDSYTYLGVNSVLGRCRPFVLSGESLVPFSTVG